MNARPSWVFFLCVKNNNKNRRLDNLSQPSSDIFHNYFTRKNLSKSIVKIAPAINKDLRNVFTTQKLQDIVKF